MKEEKNARWLGYSFIWLTLDVSWVHLLFLRALALKDEEKRRQENKWNKVNPVHDLREGEKVERRRSEKK